MPKKSATKIKAESTPPMEIPPSLPRKPQLGNIFWLILIIVALAGLSSTFYYYRKYEAIRKNPNIEAQKQSQELVATLGKLMELPANEAPTIAVISDIEKLKNQNFFTQAHNGDILFAYTTSMKAILYRPSNNKIINIAPLTINQPQDLNQGVENTTTAPTTASNNP